MALHTPHNVISFVAHGAQVDVHRHHCFQIAMSLHAGFDCRLGDKTYRDMKGFIINQNVPHSCVAQRTSVFIYFVDAESYFGWQLKTMLGGAAVIDLETLLTDEQRHRFFAKNNPTLPKEQLRQMAHEAFNLILSRSELAADSPVDERITNAIALIETRLADKLTLTDVADHICLTPERTRHLFAQSTGVPFSQFVLWNRIKRVIGSVVCDGSSLTDAALESGFADQSHFCRIFRRTFGIPARRLLQNSRFVQFLDPLL